MSSATCERAVWQLLQPVAWHPRFSAFAQHQYVAIMTEQGCTCRAACWTCKEASSPCRESRVCSVACISWFRRCQLALRLHNTCLSCDLTVSQLRAVWAGYSMQGGDNWRLQPCPAHAGKPDLPVSYWARKVALLPQNTAWYTAM